MALTPSNMLALGTFAPEFTLIEPKTGKQLSLREIRGDKATVILFICNHCPYVKHIQSGLALLGCDYQHPDVGIVAINANDILHYPEDAPEKMIAFANRAGLTYPYLFDDTQKIAKAYLAACTPDCYVFDANLRCAYRGQFDGARPGNDVPVTGHDVRRALDALLAGNPVPQDQRPSIGCNIKWQS